MKIVILLSMTLFGVYQIGWAQTHTEKISKEFDFEKAGANTVMIVNINGDVKVVSYEGSKVQVEVTKTIKAKTATRMEKGKQSVQLGVIDRADTLVFYVEGVCNNFSKTSNKQNGNENWRRDWDYNWNDCDKNCHEEFDYSMDFLVKVPASVNVLASTINDGDVVVDNVKGVVQANNINGSIRLTNLMREAEASTINGDVDIVYAKNPEKKCRFYSLNGDINALFQRGLAANLSFESFNGDFYTDIEPIESLPVKVEKSDRGGEGTNYKVSGNQYKIRTGGAILDFETFNGDVILKEK